MEIILKSNLARRAAMALEVLAFLAAIAWISKTYWAHQVAQRPTVQNLTLATKLDPGNAIYHWRLGRLYQYSIQDIDPERANEHFRRAAELSPHDSRPWLELAVTLELQGKTAEAAACLRRADFLAPTIPSVQWAIGNFYLLHGDVEEAFRHFKVVLAGTSEYNQILFSIAWKAADDADKILTELIPPHVPTEFSYLYYLVSQNRYPEAQNVWRRILRNPETFQPAQAAGYIDSLIGARRPVEAHQVWTDLLRQGLLKATYENSARNLITNGSFEEDLLKMGFDWRITSVDGAYTVVDRTTFHSPALALLIQFTGKDNLDFRHASQYVKVEPGHSYRVQGFMKTEGITTESGPRLEVRDAYDPALLREISEGLTGSSGGWSPVALEFKTGPNTELIIVAVTRPPSRKLDNLIAGKVWVDDVALAEAGSETASAR